MAESPKIPRTRAAKTAAGSNEKPETTVVESEPCCGDSRCPFASLRGGIDWMNVVDEFKIAGHQNYIPRWGFVMLVLLYFAVN
jgi:hypothetical protein